MNMNSIDPGKVSTVNRFEIKVWLDSVNNRFKFVGMGTNNLNRAFYKLIHENLSSLDIKVLGIGYGDIQIRNNIVTPGTSCSLFNLIANDISDLQKNYGNIEIFKDVICDTAIERMTYEAITRFLSTSQHECYIEYHSTSIEPFFIPVYILPENNSSFYSLEVKLPELESAYQELFVFATNMISQFDESSKYSLKKRKKIYLQWRKNAYSEAQRYNNISAMERSSLFELITHRIDFITGLSEELDKPQLIDGNEYLRTRNLIVNDCDDWIKWIENALKISNSDSKYQQIESYCSFLFSSLLRSSPIQFATERDQNAFLSFVSRHAQASRQAIYEAVNQKGLDPDLIFSYNTIFNFKKNLDGLSLSFFMVLFPRSNLLNIVRGQHSLIVEKLHCQTFPQFMSIIFNPVIDESSSSFNLNAQDIILNYLKAAKENQLKSLRETMDFRSKEIVSYKALSTAYNNLSKADAQKLAEELFNEGVEKSTPHLLYAALSVLLIHMFYRIEDVLLRFLKTAYGEYAKSNENYPLIQASEGYKKRIEQLRLYVKDSFWVGKVIFETIGRSESLLNFSGKIRMPSWIEFELKDTGLYEDLFSSYSKYFMKIKETFSEFYEKLKSGEIVNSNILKYLHNVDSAIPVGYHLNEFIKIKYLIMELINYRTEILEGKYPNFVKELFLNIYNCVKHKDLPDECGSSAGEIQTIISKPIDPISFNFLPSLYDRLFHNLIIVCENHLNNAIRFSYNYFEPLEEAFYFYKDVLGYIEKAIDILFTGKLSLMLEFPQIKVEIFDPRLPSGTSARILLHPNINEKILDLMTEFNGKTFNFARYSNLCESSLMLLTKHFNYMPYGHLQLIDGLLDVPKLFPLVISLKLLEAAKPVLSNRIEFNLSLSEKWTESFINTEESWQLNNLPIEEETSKEFLRILIDTNNFIEQHIPIE